MISCTIQRCQILLNQKNFMYLLKFLIVHLIKNALHSCIVIYNKITQNIWFLLKLIIILQIDTLYSLAKQQLSKQFHYDFGLRGIVTLTRYAGKKRRLYPHLPDEEVQKSINFLSWVSSFADFHFANIYQMHIQIFVYSNKTHFFFSIFRSSY